MEMEENHHNIHNARIYLGLETLAKCFKTHAELYFHYFQKHATWKPPFYTYASVFLHSVQEKVHFGNQLPRASGLSYLYAFYFTKLAASLNCRTCQSASY